MPIDMSQASKVPPRKSTATRSSRVAANAPDPIAEATRTRTIGLAGIAQLCQAALVVTGQYADAATVGKYGPELASELAKLASQYDIIARPVDLLIQVGPFAGLLAVAVPMTMQIMANHKLLPAGAILGSQIQPPELLEAQMQAEVTRMQLEAAREQKAAMDEARRLQAEMEKMVADIK